ncbi:MAG: hypothetical protein MJK15_18365 [Colwellia sp.]|nr:hypothetical protein [Colwellia sp.]
MENNVSKGYRSLSAKDLKQCISNDKALKKQLTSSKGVLHSSELLDLFEWSIAISYFVGIFSSLTAEKIKEKLNKDNTISKKNLRAIMPLLETKLETPDLSKLEKSVELSREVMYSFNVQDSDKKVEVKMVELIKATFPDETEVK